MNLTEPQAGSDVGALHHEGRPPGRRHVADHRHEDLHHLGEHDMADNIVHLVLARSPDAAAGTKGISCFLVPKYLVADDGARRAQRRGVRVDGAQDGHPRQPHLRDGFDDAVGVARSASSNQGMRLHVHDDEQRQAVGRAEGVAIGRARLPAGPRLRPGAQPGPGRRAATESALIIEHPDVRRMLLTMKARIEAMRASPTSTSVHRPRHVHPDAEVRGRAPGAGRPPHAVWPKRGAPTSAWSSPRSPSRSTAGWGTSRRPACPAHPRQPHRADLRGHQRHPGHRPGRPQARPAGGTVPRPVGPHRVDRGRGDGGRRRARPGRPLGHAATIAREVTEGRSPPIVPTTWGRRHPLPAPDRHSDRRWLLTRAARPGAASTTWSGFDAGLRRQRLVGARLRHPGAAAGRRPGPGGHRRRRRPPGLVLS